MKRKRRGAPSRTRGGNPAHLAPIRWSWDKLGTHFSPRQVPQRPPTSGILSPPASCDVRVNVHWLAHIIGALEALTQPDAWSERSDWAINQVEVLLAALTARIVDSYDCGCDMPFQLRQKPGAPCVLQQSLDGGLSWSDAFDFSLCLRPALQPIINYTYHQTYNQAQTSLTTIVNTYNTTGGGGQTTVETIAPEFVNKGQAAKDLTLCQACRDVVDLVCELELERRNQLGQGVQAFALVVGAVAAAFLTAISAGAMTIAGAALVSAIVEAGATGVGMVSDALLRNTEARQAVACCMYNALKGQPPTKATFSASLGGCGFTAGSNEAQLAGAIAPLLADDAVHAAFLNSLNELARWAELGLIDCECDEAEPGTCIYEGPALVTNGVILYGFGSWTSSNRVASYPGGSGYNTVVAGINHGQDASYSRVTIHTTIAAGSSLGDLRISRSDIYSNWLTLTAAAGPHGLSFSADTNPAITSPICQFLIESYTGSFEVVSVNYTNAEGMPNAACT